MSVIYFYRHQCILHQSISSNKMDVHRFSRYHDLADQALGNSLTFFKRELGKILAQQLAKGRGIVYDLVPMDALLPCVS